MIECNLAPDRGSSSVTYSKDYRRSCCNSPVRRHRRHSMQGSSHCASIYARDDLSREMPEHGYIPSRMRPAPARKHVHHSGWRPKGGNVASAFVGVERLGKNRRRDEDQDRRCGQEHFSFHSPIRRYLEPTIAFPDARPSCCCEIALATTDFAFNSPHLTTDRRVQHPTLNDRVLARIRMHQDLMGWSAPLLYAYELHAPPSASD